jgi:acetyltransferase-like isoleucine patch superfamily enzyme
MAIFHVPSFLLRKFRSATRDACSGWVRGAWAWLCSLGAIGPCDAAGRRFGHFGFGSIICFPTTTLQNERHIRIGSGTLVGPHVALSAGIAPGQTGLAKTVLRIGDRCLIGRGSGIIAHTSVELEDDVWTGHHVYITDQNHGYEDISLPISRQPHPPSRAVRIGAGSWLGHGVVVLPGSRIGRNVVIGANAVVSGDIPDFSVAVGAPARVVKRYLPGCGWVRPTVAGDNTGERSQPAEEATSDTVHSDPMSVVDALLQRE